MAHNQKKKKRQQQKRQRNTEEQKYTYELSLSPSLSYTHILHTDKNMHVSSSPMPYVEQFVFWRQGDLFLTVSVTVSATLLIMPHSDKPQTK